MEVWLRVARVLDCLGQKYNDPYHLLLRSEKVEICHQGWPGYSTASVRNIMTPTICCRDREGGNLWSRVARVLNCLHQKYNDQDQRRCPQVRVPPSHLCQTWNWSGSELCDLVQLAWYWSGSELYDQNGTSLDQSCLPLSNPHGNDLDQNFLPFCLTSMELIRIRTFCPCLTSMELIRIRTFCPCPTSMELIWIRTVCPWLIWIRTVCPCLTSMELIWIRTVCPCLTSSMTTEHLLQECLLVLALHDTDCFQCHFWLVKAGGEEAFQQSGTSGRPAQCAAASMCKELVSKCVKNPFHILELAEDLHSAQRPLCAELLSL